MKFLSNKIFSQDGQHLLFFQTFSMSGSEDLSSHTNHCTNTDTTSLKNANTLLGGYKHTASAAIG